MSSKTRVTILMQYATLGICVLRKSFVISMATKSSCTQTAFTFVSFTLKEVFPEISCAPEKLVSVSFL